MCTCTRARVRKSVTLKNVISETFQSDNEKMYFKNSIDHRAITVNIRITSCSYIGTRRKYQLLITRLTGSKS